jgi:hypothetical protein
MTLVATAEPCGEVGQLQPYDGTGQEVVEAAWLCSAADIMQAQYWPATTDGAYDYGNAAYNCGQTEWSAGVPASVWMVENAPGGVPVWQNGAQGARPGAARSKRRFCTLYPEVGLCRRGASCCFAHSREEIGASLLDPEEERQEPQALTDEFFMYKYKTRWCPIGVQHEWHVCVYAHNYQDARRPVHIGYGPRLCPYWSKKDTGAEYTQRCPLGLRCPYSHGAKEQLYHPNYFKTVVCRDLRGKACPRQQLCAFYHHRNERRPAPADPMDYSAPLQWDGPGDWVADFLSAPFMAEGSRERGVDEAWHSQQVESTTSENGTSPSHGPVLPFGACQSFPLQVDTSDQLICQNTPDNSPRSNGMTYSPQGMVLHDGGQFGHTPSGQQSMVVLVPVPMPGMPHTPQGGLSPQVMPAQSPYGIPQSPQGQWVLMPIEPTVESNAGLCY